MLSKVYSTDSGILETAVSNIFIVKFLCNIFLFRIIEP